MTTDFRALCAELVDSIELLLEMRSPNAGRMWTTERRLRVARAALADEPAVPKGREPVAVTGQPSDEKIIAFWSDHCAGDGDAGIIRLARWGNPAPVPPADGEVAELVAWLREIGDTIQPSHLAEHQRYKRAAELLQRQVLVPVSVSDALIKAECALSDIAEGEPMTDEGDPLQWAERRCADTLAIIRPTMRQHKIRTSEWPPLPLPEVK